MLVSRTRSTSDCLPRLRITELQACTSPSCRNASRPPARVRERTNVLVWQLEGFLRSIAPLRYRCLPLRDVRGARPRPQCSIPACWPRDTFIKIGRMAPANARRSVSDGVHRLVADGSCARATTTTRQSKERTIREDHILLWQ